MNSKVLVWLGSFDEVAEAAPHPAKLLPTGPKDASGKTEKRQRSSDDDDNDKAIDELEKELKRRRELQEVAKAQRIPQRIAELEKKIEEEKEAVKRLQESISKDRVELDALRKKQIPRDVAARVLQYFVNFKMHFEDSKLVYLQDRFRKNKYEDNVFTYVASVHASFDGNWYDVGDFGGFFKSTKLALLLMKDEAEKEFTQEARDYIKNSANMIPSLEMQQLMKTARAQIFVSVWKQYYQNVTTGLQGDGYETFRVTWGSTSE